MKIKLPYRYAVYAAKPCVANEERCWMNIRTKKLSEAARNNARYWFVCAINGDRRVFSAPAAELEKAFHEHAINVIDRGAASEKYSLYTDYKRGEIFSAVTQRDTQMVFSLMREPQGEETAVQGEGTMLPHGRRFEPVRYEELSERGKEAYSIQKLMSLLADYGFECQRVMNDAWGADVMATREVPGEHGGSGNEVMLLQIKGRATGEKVDERQGRDLYMAIADPANRGWYIIPDDGTAQSIIPETCLQTDTWERGVYRVRKLSAAVENKLSPYFFPWVSEEEATR